MTGASRIARPAWGRGLALLVAVGSLLLGGAARGVVTIDWVTIDQPGNPGDDEAVRCCDIPEVEGTSGYGAVDYVYRIGRNEVTNEQYAEFLNAVADSDPHGLYKNPMAKTGITRSGVSGSYSYAVIAGCAQRPARLLDFFDSLRFVNWLENGQLQDPATTEDGAYALLGGNPLDVERGPDAQIFLPSEDEWYKAAYYDPELEIYHDYPTGTDLVPSPGAPPGGTNSANFCHDDSLCRNVDQDVVGCLDQTELLVPPSLAHTVDVGSYVSSPSPFGTFDQGGSLAEWNESRVLDRAIPTYTPNIGVVRGGWYQVAADEMLPDLVVGPPLDCQGCVGVGLRVAAVPEPGATLLSVLGTALAAVLARASGGRR